ncbi:TolC family protein [bacterium]|nr:TolC family protein [bacterium]
MKRIFSLVLCIFMLCQYAIAAPSAAQGLVSRPVQASPNAKTIELAFVFDGPSDKNEEVLKIFQKTITRSLLPDYKASFPKDLIYTGDWTEAGAAKVSEKALQSRARMVVSLGYMSSTYYAGKQNKKKYVVTIDQYGLRDFGDKFFNPLQQTANDFVTFQKLVPTIQKTAILMNENFYNANKNWKASISKKLQEKNCNLDFVIVPVNNSVSQTLAKIPKDVDSVFVTPLYNLSVEERKVLYKSLSFRKLPTFSSVGREDVDLGAMLGTSTADADKKIAEATSFNIYGVLHGDSVKNEKLTFFDEKVIYYNADTGEEVGYIPPLRLLNNATTISHKQLPTYDLGSLINALDEGNLDIKRKAYLVSAAKRSVASAYLRYLPTLRMDLGYQKYNDDYAESYTDVPRHVGLFTLALDQVIYSPDLVTNIIVKHKKLKFDKAEKALTKANIEYHTADLYIDTLMLANMIKVQEEYVQETRGNYAMARVREKTGKCGYEEVLQWAGQVSEAEKKLLSMKADYNNLKVEISKLLHIDQKQDFTFKPMTAADKSFFTSDLNIIDHVRNPQKLGKFTDMLVDEVIYLSPETAKLKAAMAMKKAEMGNYAQKFVLPSAKLSLEYGSQFDRSLPYEDSGHKQMKYVAGAVAGASTGSPAAYNALYNSSPWLDLDRTSGRVLIAAQWKPFEGGHKIAEIARAKSELNELNTYMEEVKSEIEMKVRTVVNRAISKYFIIEKSYKSMFAQAENYETVKSKYLVGKVPVSQLHDAQNMYFEAKLDALNSQYEFFKELIWVQRGLLSVNWENASEDAKKWINSIPEILPAEPDFTL